MKNAVVTNMSEDEITSLIKMQLKEGNSWNFESFSLNGTSSYEYTYSYSKQKLYVMIPDYTLDDAKNKINDILKEN